jgi:hypothetical protein
VERDDLVAVAHPHPEQAVTFGVALVLDAFEQLRVAPRPHQRMPELAHFPRLHRPAELLRHRLHAVADAEHWNAQLERRARRGRGRFVVGGKMAAGEDHAPGAKIAHERVSHVPWVDLAVDLRLAHAARDQLRVLGAEIEDQDAVVHDLSLSIREARIT